MVNCTTLGEQLRRRLQMSGELGNDVGFGPRLPAGQSLGAASPFPLPQGTIDTLLALPLKKTFTKA